MQLFYNLWILVTLLWAGALVAVAPEDNGNPRPNPDRSLPVLLPTELPPDVPEIEPLPVPICREQMALRAFQLNELFLISSRSAQISMLERQLSQLAILIDDWERIPKSGSYFAAMEIRRGILVDAIAQIIAVKSSEDVARIDYHGDETLEKSSGLITGIMYSRLHRELAIISEVLVRTNIHASYFHDTRPRTIKEKISLAEACKAITKIFPNFVSCTGIMSDKTVHELLIEIDMQSVIG